MSSIIYVYFSTDKTAESFKFWANIVTLVGSIIGQIAFGIAADKWGRAKFYGYELAIILVSALGLSMCSSGIQPSTTTDFSASMSFQSWFYFWRFVMGIGIGVSLNNLGNLLMNYADCCYRLG
jgi:PHS family inorganic phosphate transporter-like MFS transporter